MSSDSSDDDDFDIVASHNRPIKAAKTKVAAKTNVASLNVASLNDEDEEDSQPCLFMQMIQDCGGIYEPGKGIRASRPYMTTNHKAKLDKLKADGEYDEAAEIAELDWEGVCGLQNVDADGDHRDKPKPRKPRAKSAKPKAKPKKRKPSTKASKKNSSPMKKIAAKGKKKQDKKKPAKDDKDE
jgi:hypothetical protein